MKPNSRAKSIGGYVELQLHKTGIYHPDLIKLNTGRNALEYILKIREYKIIYIPYFTCEVILEPIKKLGLTYFFYETDENLEPVFDFNILTDQCCFLYTNYFGLKNNLVKALASSVKNLIVDNAQAFYAAPVEGTDTFYSCRKFFGVPDGAYLSLSVYKRLQLGRDRSVHRCSHLLKSIDSGIEAGYADYLENNRRLENNNIKRMSWLSQNILESIDYEACATARQQNFDYLSDHLSGINYLNLERNTEDIPMVYPFLIDKPSLKRKMIKHKIFIATYWPNVFNWAKTDSWAYYLAKNLVAIPIDHRYGEEDMEHILHVLKSIS